MKKLVLMLMIIAFVATAAMAAMPGEVKYDTKMGTVTFDHDAHKGYGSCKDCHHSGMKGCKTCHDGEKAISAKEAYHGSCIPCHEEGGKGPAKCAGCHVR